MHNQSKGWTRSDRPRWFRRVLKRIHDLASSGAVRLTYKAEEEAVALGLALDDVCEIIGSLSVGDSLGRLTSQATREWMYVFRPEIGRRIVYVKIVLRADCVVVSFHEDEGTRDEETA
jgi:hypothetical protein